MQSSYRIFRIFGISVELHVTFLLFLGLVLLLSVSVLPFFMMVFVVVLVHELFHSLVALRCGVEVHKITLTPIGGLANIDVPENPTKEFLISVSGPLSNFLLIFIALIAAFALNIPLEALFEGLESGTMDILDPADFLGQFILINFMLGAFNMLPGFPMDGGRVFRAFLAFWLDYLQATRIAVFVGRVIALLMIMAGFLIESPWLMVIGLFLLLFGGQELQVLKIKKALEGMRVGDIAVRDVGYVEGSSTLREFMENVASPQQEHYPVTGPDRRVTGVLYMDDLAGIASPDFDRLSAGEVARREFEVLDANLKVDDVLSMIFGKDFFFVVDSGKVVGYLTPARLFDAARFYGIRRPA
ncbi:MAG: M50 family metallopeptidase [Candidatus Altiarchaeota archaeon]|nr:M50 family metallopeptidase [Candidatus Altiarchaeota archaeon]